MRERRPWPVAPAEEHRQHTQSHGPRQRAWGKGLHFYRRFQSLFLFAAGILVAVAALLLLNVTSSPPQRLTQSDINRAVARALASATPQPSFASRVYAAIAPSLVRVRVLLPNDSAKADIGIGIGTGVVIDDAGTILTSLHVVSDALTVHTIFADGTDAEAEVIVRQAANDLAVLRPKLVPDDVQPAVLGVSDELNVGDEVFAVGNPFGISNSLSAGVVSGLGRHYSSPKTGSAFFDMIQFDAAVNPGNSGGPLLNRAGEVVGIVTQLYNPTDQDVFIGIGFAVPIETAASLLGSPAY